MLECFVRAHFKTRVLNPVVPGYSFSWGGNSTNSTFIIFYNHVIRFFSGYLGKDETGTDIVHNNCKD